QWQHACRVWAESNEAFRLHNFLSGQRRVRPVNCGPRRQVGAYLLPESLEKTRNQRFLNIALDRRTKGMGSQGITFLISSSLEFSARGVATAIVDAKKEQTSVHRDGKIFYGGDNRG